MKSMKKDACFERFWSYDFAQPTPVTICGGSRRKSENDPTCMAGTLSERSSSSA
jgi:hypothetical protein